MRVLLTRVRAGTRSAKLAREVLDELGVPVLAAEIPQRERLAQAFGAPVEVDEDHRAVFDELLAGAKRRG